MFPKNAYKRKLLWENLDRKTFESRPLNMDASAFQVRITHAVVCIVYLIAGQWSKITRHRNIKKMLIFSHCFQANENVSNRIYCVAFLAPLVVASFFCWIPFHFIVCAVCCSIIIYFSGISNFSVVTFYAIFLLLSIHGSCKIDYLILIIVVLLCSSFIVAFPFCALFIGIELIGLWFR